MHYILHIAVYPVVSKHVAQVFNNLIASHLGNLVSCVFSKINWNLTVFIGISWFKFWSIWVLSRHTWGIIAFNIYMEVPQSCRKSGPILGIKIYGFETLFLLVTSWESFNKHLLCLTISIHVKVGLRLITSWDSCKRFMKNNLENYPALCKWKILLPSLSSSLLWLSQQSSRRAR